MPDTQPDFTAIKSKQQAAWATGNYARIGSSILLVPELLVESMDVRSTWHVLDVAAGSGNASLALARRGCEVTSTDFVPELLEEGKARAAVEHFSIHFAVADAENLNFADGAFDAAISTFGVMFTPNQQKSASELARVVRSGGVIGLASWTPGSFVGQLFKIIGGYVPPAAGLRPPSLWGTGQHLRELFPSATGIATRTLNMTFRAPSAEAWLENFKTFYGPMNRTFAALDAEKQTAFRNDVLALAASLNRSGDETLVLPSEYLEAVIKL